MIKVKFGPVETRQINSAKNGEMTLHSQPARMFFYQADGSPVVDFTGQQENLAFTHSIFNPAEALQQGVEYILCPSSFKVDKYGSLVLDARPSFIEAEASTKAGDVQKLSERASAVK